MDFSQAQLANLIGNQQEEQVKYNVVMQKLKITTDVVKKLYGKNSHSKLIQTSYDHLIVTSQLPLIFDNIKINHPLIKLLIDYTKKMDVVGDGATFFVLYATSLAEQILSLISRGLKPALVADTLRTIQLEIEDIISEARVVHKFEFTKKSIKTVIKGVVKDAKLEDLIAEIICRTKSFNTENVRVCKVVCGSLEDSYVIDGMVFNRVPESRIQNVSDASTVIYNCALDIPRPELKSTVLMQTADDLLDFSKRENEGIRGIVESIKADVIICSGRVDNIYLDFFNKSNKLVLKIPSKHDIKRVKELVGGQVLGSLVPHTELSMGKVSEISTFVEANIKYTKITREDSKIHSLILRNSVQCILDEQERLVLKALNVLSKNVRNDEIVLVQGAGEFEDWLKRKFYDLSVKNDDINGLVYKALGDSLIWVKKHDAEIFDVFNAKLKALKYAMEFISIMFETNVYLLGKPQQMEVAPRSNEHWDNDH